MEKIGIILEKIFERVFTLFVGLAAIVPELRGSLHYIALGFLGLFFLLLTIKFVFLVVRSFKSKYACIQNSLFVTYRTNDAIKISYEVYKHIQCKKMIMTEHRQGFKWSGSKAPEISSKIQAVSKISKNGDGNYDEAILKLPKWLLYNDSAVIHFLADIDDSDKKSQTHIQTKVDSKIHLVHYRVELGYKNGVDVAPAMLARTPISTEIPEPVYTKLVDIPFNALTKSYEYHLVNPDANYYYKLSWVR